MTSEILWCDFNGCAAEWCGTHFGAAQGKHSHEETLMLLVPASAPEITLTELDLDYIIAAQGVTPGRYVRVGDTEGNT